MKTLEQIQKENGKVIIMAENPEFKTHEECLEFVKNCKNYYSYHRKNGLPYDELNDDPLTLDRVLIALGVGFETKTFQDGSPDKDIYLSIFNNTKRVLWDLNKRILEDQSEETQRVINKLLIN